MAAPVPHPLAKTVLATLAMVGLAFLVQCARTDGPPAADGRVPVVTVIPPVPPARHPPGTPLATQTAVQISQFYTAVASQEASAVAAGNADFARRVLAADLTARDALQAMQTAPTADQISAALATINRLLALLQTGT